MSNKSVDIAVFPISINARRLLPLTYGIHKDLLPLGDRSLLHIAMAEAVEAGIKEFVIVLPHGSLFSPFAGRLDLKKEIQDPDNSPVKKNIEEWLSLLKRIIAVVPLRVDMAGGLASAVASVDRIIGQKSFAVLISDDVIIKSSGGLPNLINVWEKRKEWVLGLTKIEPYLFPEFGVVQAEKRTDNTFLIRSAVEKPKPLETSAGLGIVGRYIFDSKIFDLIKETEEIVMSTPSTTDFHLTEAINVFAKVGCVSGVMIDVPYYHVGTMKGYLEAWNHLSCFRETLK